MKISNTQLLLVFLGLLGLYLVLKLVGPAGKSNTSLPATLVSVDTAAVDRLVINTPDEEVDLVKNSGDWLVRLASGKEVPTTKDAVKNAVSRLQSLEPIRFVSQDPSRFGDFQVDSLGTRVQAYKGDKLLADVTLGRLEVKGQREFNTFLRLTEEEDVYTVKGFLSSTFNKAPAGWRPQEVTDFAYNDTINVVEVNYTGADSSFQLVRMDDQWQVNNMPADSTEVANYLQEIKRLRGNQFIDDLEPASLGNAYAEVTISTSSGEIVNLNFYNTPKGDALLSSLRPESVYAAQSNDIKSKLLKSANSFWVKN